MALSQREKALILIPVALGAVIGFYSYVHEPLMVKRAEAQTHLETVDRDLKQGQRQLAQEGDLEARRQAVAAREVVVDASVPGKNAAALFVWYLSQAEMRSGGRVKSVKVADRRAVDPADPKKQVQSLDCSGAAGSGAQAGQTNGKAGSANGPESAGGQAGSANPQPGKTNGQPGSTNGQPGSTNGQTGSSSGQGTTAPAPCSQPLPPGSIVVLSLELKLAGKFGEQLHFAQMLEEMPLFLANDQIALVRSAQTDWQKASGLIGEGKGNTAYNLLSTPPIVEGNYVIQLYFKQAKSGPATSDMTFSSEPGRKDPFAQDGVDEFTKYVEKAYNGQGFGPNPEDPLQLIPVPQQLG